MRSFPLLSATPLFGALLLGTAGAAPVLSAQSIIVNPVQTSLEVRVWTDRGSGTQAPTYRPGERIRLSASVNQDAYVYLFNVDPQGQVDLVLPNRYQSGGNFVKANTTRTFPAAGDPFTFDIAGPSGLNKVLALASLRPLDLGQIATFRSQQNSFATVNVQGQQQLAQALSIVVNPLPQTSWVSGTAFYTVAVHGAQAAPLQTPAPAPTAVAPSRGTPIQQPPRTAQALSVTVQPLPSVREWKATVQGRTLQAVYDEYAARLKAEGFTQTGSRKTGNHIRGEFRKGSARAELEVKQKGKKADYEVKVERR
ncbi:DUF4384 domain-containing protein [Deinococcus sp. MIMF12]|uniref:DUF4384 domain-containing protein n=1 Tax=Deinococcus rhizophilus TaxID=3049544 RepID=A0ABT7JIX2_9DEIO|nr:DUF4384 domain-containing protein [Deinococcus rhizophilus]MDL2345009.1 DUF4384 domain-containing protein [Deinococcus rhizophilus]